MGENPTWVELTWNVRYIEGRTRVGVTAVGTVRLVRSLIPQFSTVSPWGKPGGMHIAILPRERERETHIYVFLLHVYINI